MSTGISPQFPLLYWKLYFPQLLGSLEDNSSQLSSSLGLAPSCKEIDLTQVYIPPWRKPSSNVCSMWEREGPALLPQGGISFEAPVIPVLEFPGLRDWVHPDHKGSCLDQQWCCLRVRGTLGHAVKSTAVNFICTWRPPAIVRAEFFLL